MREKPELQYHPAVVSAAMMGLPCYVVTRPAFTYNKVRYVDTKSYHSSLRLADEDFKFCRGTEGDDGVPATLHAYTHAECIACVMKGPK